MKKLLIVLGLLVIVVATIPLWGGCDLNGRLCSTWCGIKHFNNDMKAAGCRVSCSLENARCQGAESARQLDDFMSGLKGK